jgi:hypothetical protein
MIYLYLAAAVAGVGEDGRRRRPGEEGSGRATSRKREGGIYFRIYARLGGAIGIDISSFQKRVRARRTDKQKRAKQKVAHARIAYMRRAKDISYSSNY